MRYFYAVAFLLLASHTVCYSQAVTIRGKVKNTAGDALAYVTVSIKGSKTSITTDQLGEFSIVLPQLPGTLIFTYVGYEIKELVVKKKDSLNYLTVKLKEDLAVMSEVVVVGYGTARKMSFSEAAPARARRSTAKDVEGKTPGLAVSSGYVGSATSTGGHSKVLTAGELSDFKKWKLWEGYTKEEFKQWSAHWGITPVNRFCVQVQNEERREIAGEKVFLVNLDTKDTVWRAVTDNTGKAELWGNIHETEKGQNNYAIVCRNQEQRFPTGFEKGINRFTLKKDCTHSNSADIAFVVDATGSMSDEIAYLQAELQDVIASTASKNKGVDLRIASVFYRDRTDQYLTRSIDFQTDPSALIEFIKEQGAAGGNDRPEAVDEALAVALDKLQWQSEARAKIIFLILDAPPHDAAKERMKKLIGQAAAMGVRIVPVTGSGIDKSTEYLMRSIALATNGSYVFLTDDSGVGDGHIKPTTDYFKVELLNDVLQRLISEMIYIAPCDETEKMTEPLRLQDNFAKLVVYPNPSRGRIQIRCSGKINELYITDFTGKLFGKDQHRRKNQ